MKNQRWLRLRDDTIDLGDLHCVLRFIFINWENHQYPNVRMVAIDGALELMITFNADTDQENIEDAIKEMISFAHQYKIRLVRK